MTEEDKIKKGILFYPEDEELVAKKTKAHDLSRDFNKLYERDRQERERIISELVGEIGDGSFFLGPIAFHYGCHTSIGKDCFFNFNFTVQDDAEVMIGDNCQFGPNVTIVTPVHPIVASERKAMQRADGSVRVLCYAKPVHIGRGCWFGANVVVCPGGDDRRRLCHRSGERCHQGYSGQLSRRGKPVQSASGNNRKGQHGI